jgi:xanthine dehydrogenase accessory factor
VRSTDAPWSALQMQAVDREVLSHVRDWLAAGEPAWLCTVVATWGSSPRPVGSLLGCDRRGNVVGSLSGGCVEDDLIDKLRGNRLATSSPCVQKYGLDPSDTERLGLPCGGHLHVVVEPLAPSPQRVAAFTHIVGRLARRRCVERTLDLATGEAHVTDREHHAALEFSEDGGGRLRQTYGPRFQLFLVGAGMVSHYLAQMAQALDYHVTVCDPREHLLEQWQVDGVQTLCAMPDDAIREHASDPMTAIVALTHDPRVDDMGLMEALRTDAFYVGAMGSARTSAKRRERLALLDLSQSQIARLHAPVGLPIGSKTPPEIAIAILAEITAVRKGVEARVRAHLAALAAPQAAA